MESSEKNYSESYVRLREFLLRGMQYSKVTGVAMDYLNIFLGIATSFDMLRYSRDRQEFEETSDVIINYDWITYEEYLLESVARSYPYQIPADIILDPAEIEELKMELLDMGGENAKKLEQFGLDIRNVLNAIKFGFCAVGQAYAYMENIREEFICLVGRE